MRNARCSLTLAYFGGFIYAIGGRDNEGNLDSVERFNLSTQRWDGMYTLPNPMVNTRAAVLNNQLLVYGLKQYDRRRGFTCAMVIFDQLNQEWIQVLEEVLVKDVSSEKSTIVDPEKSTIVVQAGKCYRVYYTVESESEGFPTSTHVNRVEVTWRPDGTVAAAIKEAIPNDVVRMRNEAHAFAIEETVYINISGTLHELPQHRMYDTLEMHLQRLQPVYASDNSAVEFTIDLSKVFPEDGWPGLIA